MSPLSSRQSPPADSSSALSGPGGGGAEGAGDPRLADAATRFEALILGEMLRAMRKATTGSGLGRSDAERTFRDLQDRMWAEGLAKAAPIGLVARLAPAAVRTQPLPAPAPARAVQDAAR
jgi:flagellar protein FlgJ